MNRRNRWLASALCAVTGSIAIGAAVMAIAPVEAKEQPSTRALPAHALTGYWQNFDNGATNLRLRDVPRHYDLIVVAFGDAEPTRPGGVTFALDPTLSSRLGGYSEADFKADIATLHGQGRKVIISVGGEKGNVPVGDATAAANFANSIHGLMTKFGFDGVDIDLEHGLNPTHLGSALRQLSGKAGRGLVLTMAPQTIDIQTSTSAYMQLIGQVKDILTVVHTQYYNSGSMLGCDQKVVHQGSVDFITAQACLLLRVLRPDQVALGLPASPRGAGSGYVSPTIVNNALSCLAQRRNCGAFTPTAAAPGIRGAMTWSINWDAANGYNFANTVGPYLDTLPGGGTPTDPDPTPTVTTPPSSPPPGSASPSPSAPSGKCTAPAWNASSVYTGGAKVSHNGHTWRAKWWTQGETPGTTGEWGVWADEGPC